ncbi:MFS transporter [Mycobacterium sp. WMMD1722]|uniref:MFS transporter n=1 Tax=Mycobacterium sp. WMMD1722 TaxID=3404117 RepID=UPI003BF4ACB6
MLAATTGQARPSVADGEADSTPKRAKEQPTTGTAPARSEGATHRGGVRGAFGVPNYRRFVAGQSLSLIGSWAETIALGLLVLQLTHSPLVLGFVMGTRYLPVLLATPYAGLIVDRSSKRRVLMLTNGVLGLTSLILGGSVLAGTIALWQIFVAATVFGVMTALDNPARTALIPELVGTDLLRPAITVNSTMANVGRALGPAVAAGLIRWHGIGWCYLFNALSFALVMVALLAVDTRQLHPTTPAGRSKRQLREGLAVARANRDIAGPLLMMACVGTLTYEFETSLPVLAEQTLDVGVNGYAWLTMAFGIGSVIAGVVIARWPITGLKRMIRVTVVYGIAMLLLTVSSTLPMALVSAGLVGCASIAFLTTGNSTIQLEAPPQMRGRVTGLWTTAFIGSTPIGAVIIGAVAHRFGGHAGVAAGVVGCALAVIIGTALTRRDDPPSITVAESR